MSRPEGPGAIRFLDDIILAVGDLEMREALWRGDELAPLLGKLGHLYFDEREPKKQLHELLRKKEGLLRLIEDRSEEAPTLERAKRERQARYELPTVKAQIKSAEAQIQIRNLQKEIDETLKKIKELPPNDREKAAYPWQRRAVELMAIHKYLDHNPDADHTASPAGSKITTHELQDQLRAEGYHVDDRVLRRFMRVCGVAGQQGSEGTWHLSFRILAERPPNTACEDLLQRPYLQDFADH